MHYKEREWRVITRYFKFVATFSGQEDWMMQELKDGSARFGWSGPGSDLRRIKEIPSSQRTSNEKVTWRYTQFLMKRLTVGDRLVIQLKRPLRQFLIAEVTGEYGSTDPEMDDFNHYVECRLLTNDYIRVASQMVSQQLRHHLSKRGQYYEIYNSDALDNLERIEKISREGGEEFEKLNQEGNAALFASQALEEELIKKTYERISQQWPSAHFESFVKELIESMAGVEVKKAGDSGKGWDLTIKILDPFDGSDLLDDIPVQCKNYQGNVRTEKPIEDLIRCSRNSKSNYAYLFIMGDISQSFEDCFKMRMEETKQELGRDIEWRMIGQEDIAKLYLKKLNALT
ncbi:restriction endonuclease [Halobacillus litoralis]|uniref:restriction endonuclease n=1 Tax=Halobacillus litoralis TaxID=45668 RepID=UPI00136F16FD|nr:restriction endonuclease [Halobacillus litoralis]MYL36904.1 hypothetical protein [Halobacillus litoralis]